MPDKRHPMTQVGHKAMVEKLNNLKGVERPKIVAEIEAARAHGDISENAEYHAAKERYGFIQGKIDELSGKLATAEVVNPAQLNSEKVIFGATVQLEDLDSEEEILYQIVGEDESDVKQGKISFLSPIARALLGKVVGDEVSVNTPKGARTFVILDLKFV